MVRELERQDGNVIATADALGVPRKTLYDKLKKLRPAPTGRFSAAKPVPLPGRSRRVAVPVPIGEACTPARHAGFGEHRRGSRPALDVPAVRSARHASCYVIFTPAMGASARATPRMTRVPASDTPSGKPQA